MKAIVIHRYGEEARLEERPRPVPGAKELLVEVAAASINPLDYKIQAGAVKVILRLQFPLTLGNDLSGTVVEVGREVTRFHPGDEVYARVEIDRLGAFAEYALVGESAAAPKPASLSHVEAASIPLVGLTAWQALLELGHLEAGQTALIHGGSGGVGSFAIQLAHHVGARVATTVGARNAALMKQLSADIVVDYRTERFEEVVRGADVVLDTMGGETLLRSFDAVKRAGTVVTLGGVPDGKWARSWGLNPFLVFALSLMMRKVTRRARQAGARFEYLFMRPDGDQLAKIAALLDAGKIRPIIDRTFPLAETRAALAYSKAGHATGKVVVTVRN